MEYVTIYNIDGNSANIIYLILGIMLIFFVLKYNLSSHNKNKKSCLKCIMSYNILVVSAILIALYIDGLKLENSYKHKKYKVVEGVVRNHEPYIDKKQLESFYVKDVRFEIDNIAFQKKLRVYDGLKVKIYYTGDNCINTILRVEKIIKSGNKKVKSKGEKGQGLKN